MVDHLTPAARSKNMAAVRSRDTKPELVLRSALREGGLLGYRIGPPGLPGRPDVAYTRWRLAIFVDGAYWHGHPDHFDPGRASEYWRTKIAKNQDRDRRANAALIAQGWTVLRFWDFEVMKNHRHIAMQIGDELAVLGRPAHILGDT